MTLDSPVGSDKLKKFTIFRKSEDMTWGIFIQELNFKDCIIKAQLSRNINVINLVVYLAVNEHLLTLFVTLQFNLTSLKIILIIHT